MRRVERGDFRRADRQLTDGEGWIHLDGRYWLFLSELS